jgi:hypothetical protein
MLWAAARSNAKYSRDDADEMYTKFAIVFNLFHASSGLLGGKRRRLTSS